MNIKKLTTIKTILLALVLTISVNQLFAQTTNGIFFQAVARDNFSNPAKDRKIYVQSSIIQATPTGTKVLTEEHQANTDATGVFSISLGNGVRVGGTATGLGTIDWSKGPFYLNLKVAITPIGGNTSWDYNKEWLDMGTTSFGAVPFALYSASSAKVDDKLNITDTTTMLAVYAKAMSVKTLETSLATKLTAADTLTMLAPYAKAAYTIDSNFFKTQLATKLNLSDSTNSYVTPTQLAAKTFDQTPITNAIATKLALADSATKYVTPTQLASYNFSSGGGGTTIDTSNLSNRINLKANTTDLATIATNVASNTASITANTNLIAVNTSDILLKATSASPKFTGTVAIGTTSPSAAAALDITSTSQGLLLPRLTYIQKSAIASPEAGLVLWCSDCGTSGEMQVYNGTSFVNMVGAAAQLALPVISSTTGAYSITTNSAISGGVISSDGGANITVRGIVWGTSTEPTIALVTKTTDGVGTGTFTSSITGLTSGITYYVRSYATNSVGTKYGEQITLNTAQAVATLAATTTASSIEAATATTGGNITYNGGATVTVSGVVWSTTTTPTIELATITTDGATTGTYTSNITGLTPGTLYYVRSYATNSVGTNYGAQTSFTTLNTATISATASATSITAITATSGGTITADGGATVTARGVVYGTSAGSSTYSVTTGTGTGTYTSSLIGLTPATTYYARSFATNSVGTVYGAETSFTTLSIAPTLTTTTASSITKYAASAGGTITSNGGSTITASGICWSTTATPTTSNTKTTDGTTSGTYTSSITGLTAGTTYYVRAYATNGIGTSYGANESFTTLSTLTLPTLPTVGSSYGGGVVAYVYQDRDPGYTSINIPVLITGNDILGFTRWHNGLDITTGATATALGTGSANTNAITANQGASTGGFTYAAALAKAYNGGGFTDWYLPSQDELNKLFLNKVAIGGFDGTMNYFWTSTELSASNVVLQNFLLDNTTLLNFPKSATGGTVRAVRTVTLAPSNNPTLATTTTATGVSSTTATTGGNVTDEGATQVRTRGLVYGTSSDDTYVVTVGSGAGTFTTTLTGLTPGTTYFVRSFATNVQGTGYGAETSFTTQTTATVSVTATPTSLTTTTAIGGGTISSTGGATITTSGLVWDASANPTIALSTKTTDGTTTGTFTSSITGLTQGTTYHVRAYATNIVGTTYGPDITFTTITTPTVSATATVTSITGTTATSGGTISADGGASVIERGLVWGTSTGASTYSLTTGTGTGTFTSSLTGLSVATTYFVRAFATNSVGSVYGPEVSFATMAVEPTLSATSDATSITGSSATSGGTITDNGGATVTVSGLVWSTTSTPTIALLTKTTNGAVTGTYTNSLTGLAPATLYYVRAYATNSIGTAYGPQSSFTTLAIAPTISATATVTSITGTTATSGGTITADGGASVTERGLVWGTSSEASTYSVTTGTGTGTYTSSLTGLSVATTYFVRAFATNSVGIVYGPEVSFATPTTATLSSTTTSTITITSAILGGVLSSNGGATTTVGIMYSTSSSFGTSTSTTINSNAIAGTYTTTITGLSGATIYYAKSYATNTAGTTYGPTISFTTNEADKIVGQLYGGGAVFYILKSGDPGYDANVQHGLILAPIGLGFMNWNTDNRTTGATGTALGTGASNTNAIIASQGGALTNSAAGKARSYNGGGYTDWYLGSLEEIRILNSVWSWSDYLPVEYRYFEPPFAYWTSTESSTNNAQAIRKNIGSNDQYTETKNSQSWSVTAIRSF